MSVKSTLERLTEVIEDVLDVEDLTLTRTTTAEQVEGWDSLAHVRIVIAAEEEFGMHFTTHEVAALKSVGGVVDLIDSKL